MDDKRVLEAHFWFGKEGLKRIGLFWGFLKLLGRINIFGFPRKERLLLNWANFSLNLFLKP